MSSQLELEISSCIVCKKPFVVSPHNLHKNICTRIECTLPFILAAAKVLEVVSEDGV